MFLKDIIVLPSQIKKLLSNLDSLNEQEINKQVNSIYIFFAIQIAIRTVIGIGTSITIILIANSQISSTETVIAIGIATLISSLIHSYIFNRYVTYPSNIIVLDYILRLQDQYKNIFTDQIRTTFSEAYSTLYTYVIDINSSITTIIAFFTTLITVVALPYDQSVKFGVTVFFIVTACFISQAGKHFIRSTTRVSAKLTKHQTAQPKDVAIRTAFPAIQNSLFSIISFIGILLAMSNYRLLIIPLYSISSFATVYWTMLTAYETFYKAKASLAKLNQFFDEISDEAIFNKKTYVAFCNKCTVAKSTLSKSKRNHSLVLEDFMPMAYTNLVSSDRKFTYEFTPGMYQLIGPNGIGKTTLLESLSLTNDQLVEISSGNAAINGEALFFIKIFA